MVLKFIKILNNKKGNFYKYKYFIYTQGILNRNGEQKMVTNASIANYPYLGLPGTGISNFGGRTQIFTTDDFGSTNTRPSMTLFGNGGIAPANISPEAMAKVNPYSIVNQAQGMLAQVFNPMASSNIDSALGAITTQKNQLIAKYNSGNASNELKSVIKVQVEQLENYERQLNYLKANSGNLDPQTAYQRSCYIKHGVENLINLSTTTIKAMEAQAAQQAQQAQETQQGEKPQEDSLEAKAQTNYDLEIAKQLEELAFGEANIKRNTLK